MVLTSRDFHFAGPDVEGPHRYHEGGYHPVHLGDLYNHDRYKIIHKLGFGTYSTVWLARDLVAPETRYVALKFIIAQASEKNIEIRILKHLAHRSEDHPGFHHVLGLLDHFRVKGVNGEHDVLVLEVLGPRLCDMIEDDPDLLQKRAQALAHQITLGTAYLHANGIAHGDLHTANVAFQIVDLSRLPEQTVIMDMSCGIPRCVPVIAKDHEHQTDSLPKYLVVPGSLVSRVDKQWTTKIIDFGEAFFASERPAYLHVPIAVRAPELIFNRRSSGEVDNDWDSRSDLWSLGCLIYELVSTTALFHQIVADEERLIFDMTRVLGKLPERWQDYWDWSKKLNPDGTPLVLDRSRASLEQKIEDVECRELVDGLVDLLRKMLVLDPKDRIAAPDLLKDRWFNHI